MKMYDITRTLSPSIAVWPGDRPFGYEWTARIGNESSVNVGAVSMSTHTGTHADAPLHFLEEGASIDRIPLEAFVGTALVVDVGEADEIGVEHVQGVDLPRILFKTRASEGPNSEFSERFPHISPEAVEYLGRVGVILVGTDAPSMDPFDSKDLPAHKALAAAGIVNLENLVLTGVAAGVYQLYALPLKLEGLDAAPVRAILLR